MTDWTNRYAPESRTFDQPAEAIQAEPEEPRFHKEHLWIVGILSAVIASGVTAVVERVVG